MRALFSVTILSLSALLASAQSDQQTFELNPLLVNANRLEPNGSPLKTAVSSLDLQALDSAHFRDISDALASYPGIASYRRTHATTAHPTTQGVRLRNVGANATSRVLVLYNGVPQNDPFGAWVYWHQFDLSQIEAISIHPSGSGELWGNMASGGLISIIAQDSVPGSAELQTSLGTSNRFDLRANAAFSVAEAATLDISFRHFETDGFHTLRQDQRGPVDQPANSQANLLNTRLSWGSTETWNSQFAARLSEEKRSNGTALARNDTDAYDLSFITERQLPDQDARLNISLYFQDRTFRNVFSSVAADRTSESPALDQYDVPAQSYGGALVYRQDADQALSYTAGLDFRAVKGATNERFRNLGNGFTRDRYAGGQQNFLGLFATATSTFDEKNTLSATARLDRVEQNQGRRTETDTTNNAVLLDETYPDRHDTLLTGNLSWQHAFTQKTSSHLSLFSGFRAPTLNELYRPFRVRNDITEANPDLANERQQGVELALNHRSETGNSLRLSTFHYEIDEMVTNALLTTTSGFDPRFGFIPAGGSGSLRVNLDQTTVSGFELSADRQLTTTLQASLSAVYAKTKIDADELAQFVNKTFPQSPPWRAVASLDWQATKTVSIWTHYTWADRSYEDLGNNTRLGANADLSLGARYQINESNSIALTVTNALDEQIVSGISNDGLVTIDEPRELLLTYSWKK